MTDWIYGSGGYEAPRLASLPTIEHRFGTRRDPPPAGVRLLRQVHSSRVLEAGAGCDAGEGDALMTNERGVWLGVKTADCVPVLLADAGGRAVAAVHAGWRGTRSGIVQAAVEQLRSRYGVTPEALYAAIGPSIGPCCYEVGEEVARQFPARMLRRGSARPYLDLWMANEAALREAGVPESQVEVARACTCCRPGDFHSWRRDGEAAGRMYASIRLVSRQQKGAPCGAP